MRREFLHQLKAELRQKLLNLIQQCNPLVKRHCEKLQVKPNATTRQQCLSTIQNIELRTLRINL